jgi:hypothetical protein
MTVDDIALLWAEGLPMSEIANKLGPATTRSVVAGKVARARQAGDPRFPPRPQPPAKPRVKAGRKASPVQVVRDVANEPVAVLDVRNESVAVVSHEGNALRQCAGVPLCELPADGCRYAIGQTTDGRHVFCGRPRLPRRAYCAQHYAEVTVSSASSGAALFRAPSSREQEP